MNPGENPSVGQNEYSYDAAYERVAHALAHRRITEEQMSTIVYVLELMRHGALEVRGYKDLDVSPVTDVRHAPALNERHRLLNIASRTARNFYELLMKKPDQPEVFHKNWAGPSGFFETYTEDMMADRIRSDQFLVLMAQGSFYNTKKIAWDPHRDVADIHIKLPEDHRDAKLTAPMPPCVPQWQGCPWMQPESKKIHKAIMKNPAIAACIADISVSKGYSRYELATMMHNRAFDYLVKEVNPQRKNPIKYIIAQMYSIHGMRVPGEGRRLKLQYHEDNLPSINKHTFINGIESRYMPYIQPEDTPVEFEWEGQTKQAIFEMGWVNMAIELDVVHQYAWMGNSYPEVGREHPVKFDDVALEFIDPELSQATEAAAIFRRPFKN